MNRTSSADDDHTPTASDAPSNQPVLRIALIDLTKAELVIAIGRPSDDVAGASLDTPRPVVLPGRAPRSCSRPGVLRTRARHFGDGTAGA